MNDPQLLPCPFCGGEAKLDTIGMMSQSPIVYCTKCHAEAESQDTIEKAVFAWNCRFPTIEAAPINLDDEELRALEEFIGNANSYEMGAILCKTCDEDKIENISTELCHALMKITRYFAPEPVIEAPVDVSIDDSRIVAPTEAAPMIHAQWTQRNDRMDVFCSECGTLQTLRDSNYKSRYCPYCGALMDAGGKPGRKE